MISPKGRWAGGRRIRRRAPGLRAAGCGLRAAGCGLRHILAARTECGRIGPGLRRPRGPQEAGLVSGPAGLRLVHTVHMPGTGPDAAPGSRTAGSIPMIRCAARPPGRTGADDCQRSATDWGHARGHVIDTGFRIPGADPPGRPPPLHTTG